MVELPENCPVCGAKMDTGYITHPWRLKWTEGKEPPSFWVRKGYSRKRTEIIAGHGTLGTAVRANKCPNCKIVIFSYVEE